MPRGGAAPFPGPRAWEYRFSEADLTDAPGGGRSRDKEPMARFLKFVSCMRPHAFTAAPLLALLGCGSSLGGGPDGGGGAGGNAACQQIATLDHTCATDSDCVAVVHTTSCCGSASWLGLRATESQRFSTLESACDRSYPACGCAAGPPPPTMAPPSLSAARRR